MKLLLLGTTGYHPNDVRHTACFMLPSIGVVLDAGTAMYRVREHLCTPNLDIFITHAHLDHVVGLTYLFDVIHEKETRDVRVHGDARKLKSLSEHLFAEDLFPVRPPFTWEPLTEPVPLKDGGQLTFFPVEHPGGALAYRLNWERASMAYVTDTTASPEAAYVESIRGVDVLVHECYFPDGREELARHTGHSCITPVAHVARAAGVGRLVLVHTNPLLRDPAAEIQLADARKIFPNIEFGSDAMEIEV